MSLAEVEPELARICVNLEALIAPVQYSLVDLNFLQRIYLFTKYISLINLKITSYKNFALYPHTLVNLRQLERYKQNFITILILLYPNKFKY